MPRRGVVTDDGADAIAQYLVDLQAFSEFNEKDHMHAARVEHSVRGDPA